MAHSTIVESATAALSALRHSRQHYFLAQPDDAAEHLRLAQEHFQSLLANLQSANGPSGADKDQLRYLATYWIAELRLAQSLHQQAANMNQDWTQALFQAIGCESATGCCLMIEA